MKEFKFNEKVSKIVVSNEEINFLKEIIPNSKFSLLYRATIDGDSFKTFHSKVDGKAQTIILFKISKDKKWGAYTNNPWSSNGGCDDHPKAIYFLFSISNQKKYIKLEFNIEIPFINTIQISLEVSKETSFSEMQLKSIISPL